MRDKRGYRAVGRDFGIVMDKRRYVPADDGERQRLVEYVGDVDRVYCVKVPDGLLVVPRADDEDGRAVMITGVCDCEHCEDSRLA